MVNQFVIVVDAQNDFMREDGALYVKGAQELIPSLEEFIKTLNPENTVGVLFTYDTHIPAVYALSDEGRQFPPHCVKGTKGWELVVSPTSVPNGIPSFTLEKGVFDMWAEDNVMIQRANAGMYDDVSSHHRDEFFSFMRSTRAVEKFVVVGVAADFCVKWAVDGIVKLGVPVEIPSNLTAGIVRQIHRVVDEDFQDANVRVV